jgi:hypothetical protein
MNASSDFTPTTDLLGGSPKNMYLFFLLQRAGKYLDAMMNPDGINVGTATASLLVFCPNEKKRDEFLDKFHTLSKDPNVGINTASILTVGDFQAYISQVMEFTDTSTGGF